MSNGSPLTITAPTTININRTVKVRLTEYGRTLLRRHCDRAFAELGFIPMSDELRRNARGHIYRHPDVDGYYAFQLYELMHIFGGEAMPSGATSVNIPFVDCEIIVQPFPY